MLSSVARREEATVTGKTETLVVFVGLLVVEDLDDLLAFAADHHRIIFRMHVYRASTAFEKFWRFFLDFEKWR